ncbi:MAG: hypothetical protein HY042_11220, partial [Spirochaetia bacterium]|nr:hypothetical protein [Spirochaetia bacterium]
YPVFVNGQESGRVLSGAHSPVLKRGIGTTYLPAAAAGAERIEIGVRDKRVPAAVQKGAFVKGTAGVGKKEPA